MLTNCTNDEEYKKEKSTSKQIDKINIIDKTKDKMYLKLLLLGAGDSGKSTIFKQVVNLYGKGYSKSKLSLNKSLILKNITRGILELLDGLRYLKLKLERQELEHRFETFKENTELTKSVATDIKMLWNDPSIQQVWQNKTEINFPYENFEYYVENIDRIAVGFKKYQPNFDDWIRCRVTTVGITSAKFKLHNALFQMYDVGGQRSERNKWIKCFDNVVNIIFVASLSGYDQVLFENHSSNRMEEAIKVWDDIVNNNILKDVGFILFLNKHDLFLKKISTHLFKNEELNLNIDYNGMEPSLVPENQKHQAKNECAQYIKDKFYQVTQARVGYGLFACHYTTAISSEGMDTVLQKTQEQILKKSLIRNGFPLL